MTGATGVIVGGVSYDVTFADGTCAELFSGCDDKSDFIFDQAGALQAAQSLLDQVFIDTFDTAPNRIRGCTLNSCVTFIPAELAVSRGVDVIFTGASNYDVFQSSDFASLGILRKDTNTSTMRGRNFAVFMRSPINTAVPEPSTWAMLILGFAAVGASLRRSRTKRRVRFAFG